MEGWRVLGEESMSLHKYIYFEMRVQRGCKPKRKLERGILDGIRRNGKLAGQGDAIVDIETLTRELKREQARATGRVREDPHGNTVYWWTAEIAEQRSRTLAARRSLSRSDVREGQEANRLREAYKTERRILRKMIQKEKSEC